MRFTATGKDTFALAAADSSGTSVASIEAVTFRPLPAEQLSDTARAVRDTLFQVRWAPLSPEAGPAAPAGVNWAWLDTERFPLHADETMTVGTPVPRYSSIAALAETLDAAMPMAVLLPCVFQPLTTMTELHQATHHLLALLQEWLTDERLTTTRLVICTRN
uniref:hypothetical protein n=1 Tax=Streptomyces sp. NRRL F-5126 TaxID=1463857 RepID=UPI00055BA4D9